MYINDYDFIFKIIEVGNRMVGKRSFFIRYTQNYFTEDYHIGIELSKRIKKIEIENKLIKCLIYDIFNSYKDFTDRIRQTSEKFIKFS